MKNIQINNFEISNDKPFTLIAGPCVIENRDHALMIAESINLICSETNTNYIFKASFDKANRTSIKSERGIGFNTCSISSIKTCLKNIICICFTTN
jgi:2-dehydro-3-deoxyphosphooctonate aldolase (KDO 8-P synthase)